MALPEFLVWVNISLVSVGESLLRGRIRNVCAVSGAFGCVQHNRGYCTLYSLYFQKLILHKVSEFFYVHRGHERHNIEFASYFVEFFYVR